MILETISTHSYIIDISETLTQLFFNLVVLLKASSNSRGSLDPNQYVNFQLKSTTSIEHPTPTDCTQEVTLVHPIHKFAKDDTAATTMIPKRMAVSARRTHALQKSGLCAIRDKVTSKQMDEPRFYGYLHHYNSICCWGDRDVLGSWTTEENSPTMTVGGETEDSVFFSDVFNTKKPDTQSVPNPDLKWDFKKYRNKIRSSDKHLWPEPNTKAISSHKTLAEMMTLGYVVKELAKSGIIPVVNSKGKSRDGPIVRVPFGPMLDNQFKPYLPGKRFKASAVYNQFRLKKSMDYNDPWLTNIWMANALVLRLPVKNGLPTNLPVEEGLSPLGELLRIDAHDSRLGFFFYGSGGNPVVTGFASPDPNTCRTASITAVEGACFENTQKVTNKMNLVMQQICEQSRPVVVFLSGACLPSMFYDSTLQRSI